MLSVYKFKLPRVRITAVNVNLIGLTRNKCDINKNIIPELAAAYIPKDVEKNPLKDDFFAPPKTSKERFSLILPPPNVTGTLHLGHALTATIQDVLVKWNRMCGKETLWIPGTDHAGIATQVIVEKKLWNERRKTRHEIGRKNFINEVWNWKREKSDVIGEQLRRLGASLDWRKEFFTMDEVQSKAVIEAFISLHEQNLIYEADALVNWSCILRSAISDIEVDHLNLSGSTKLSVPGYENLVEFGVMNKFAYKIIDTDEEIVVATTRPETMLGDVAVAVHPRDERYTPFIGKKLWHPFRKETIPIVCDEFVDPDFGTGAVKITPAHDPNDFELAKRNSLPVLNAITEDGNIESNCAEFHNKKRFDVRTEILKALSNLSLCRGREDHSMVVPICSRSKDVVEFMVKPQWFVKCDAMAQKTVEDVRNGNLTIEPKQFEKVWFNWLENIRNWCISRQLWWGHRIPIYICSYKNEIIKIAARNHEEAKEKAFSHWSNNGEGINIRQVDDVLDTWFSSALLPFSSLGWPQKTEDLNKNYPLSIMETGHDILFFWVARMVMLGTHLTGTLPFSEILLHGVVCDSRGKKMSKSLGNVIAPEDVISGRTLKELEEASKLSLNSGVLTIEEFKNAVQGQRKMFPEGIPECGIDALRFTLCSHNIKNHYINFDVQECKTNKLFGNKLWQATKFSVKWCQEISRKQTLREKSPDILPEMDKWILSRLSKMVDVVNEALKNADFHNATTALKNFLYYDFCDVYLETTKRGLKDLDSEQANSHCLTLVTCLDVGLRCLAPFMPYLSQHLHQQLRVHPAVKEDGSIYFPSKFHNVDEELENEVEVILNVVTGIRRMKKVFNLTAKHKREALLVSKEKYLTTHANTIIDLAGFERVTFYENESDVEKVANGDEYVRDTISDNIVIYIYVPEELKKSLGVDLDRMDKKRAKLMKDLEKMNVMISSDGYKIKVSAEGHEKNMEKLLMLKEKISRIDYVKALVGNKL